MKSSRIAAQQSAVLHFFASVIESFGASTVDIKSLLPYIFGPQVGTFSRSHSRDWEAASRRSRRPPPS